MEKVSQSELAQLFQKSQRWVSGKQSQGIDPMPRDRAGAIAWGRRLGLLSDGATKPEPGPLFNSPPPMNGSAMELEELRLKSARADLYELKVKHDKGELLELDQVERREVAIASEFRRAACEYPRRIRPIIERHISDPVVVAQILKEIEPMAAELLNQADARQALKGKTKEEIRILLTEWVESLMEQFP